MFDFIDIIDRGHDIAERMQRQIDEDLVAVKKSKSNNELALSLCESCEIMIEAGEFIVKNGRKLIAVAAFFNRLAEALDSYSEDSEESAEDAMDEEALNEQSESGQIRRIIDYSTKSVIAKQVKTTRAN